MISTFEDSGETKNKKRTVTLCREDYHNKKARGITSYVNKLCLMEEVSSY
jgi:hypothetical protein